MNPRRIARAAGESVTRTLRISRWELSTGAGTVDRKTALALVAMALVVGTVGLSVVDQGAGLEDDVYRVGVADGSPYAAVVADDDRFALEETTYDAFVAGESDADIFVGGPGRVEPADTAKGDAAYDAFRDAIGSHNERLMAAEDDAVAAYPVSVSIQYQQRTVEGASGAESGDSSTETGADGGEDRSADGASGDPFDGDSGRSEDDGRLRVPDVGGGSLGEGIDAGTPGAIAPPFPFRSLLLAFLFVAPMNFVIQAYGSTIMDERIKRRGELLLVSPVSRREIVAGKTLPYLLGLGAVVTAIAAAVGGSWLSVAAALPIALLFLSATFVGAMFARSFKELTFVTVSISVCLTTYTFVPAIFTDVNSVALISPLSIVVMDLQGTPVAPGEYLFSTAAFYLGSAVCFLLGIGVYREEDMFTQKALPSKAVDAIAARIRGYRSVPLLSILFIPFVFGAELLVVALLFALPETVSLPILFVCIAAIEELAKSVHVYAGFARSRFESSLRTGVVLGTLAGAGFFVGEKLTHVVQFVGLRDLVVGQAAFGPVASPDPLVLVVLFFVPLGLHAVTATVSAIGASRGRTSYAMAFVAAVLVHAVYNVGVLFLVA